MNLGGVNVNDPGFVAAVREERLRLRGRALRFVLVNELARHGTLTVAEMVTIVRRYRFDLGGRESKIISDALRWELTRGRVSEARLVVCTGTGGHHRPRHGGSGSSRSPRFVGCRLSLRHEPNPHPTHRPNPQDGPPTAEPHIDWPPWYNFNWLWNT